ncbi:MULTISPECIES: DUF2946 family protein [unclassified Sphingomonas]|uniref:DUF2946 family protein n=1 Tax=unclassified Sphingomonas TaxID=196159 RepID=UPI001484E32E|nr:MULTISPECIES: DUF2946 family protein [unclassified Sphingomonas]
MLLCVLLLAFVWQGAVVQTHNHFDRGVVLGAADSGWTGIGKAADRQAPADSPANCPICREVANVAAVLLPASVSLAAPAPVAFHTAPAHLPILSFFKPPRTARSRAPPLPLQT